ncbi:MAG: hypothetical protein ABIF77_19895 [bacterium]
MKRRKLIRLGIGVASLLCLALAGCQHYELEIVLEPDGSGTRTVLLDAGQQVDERSDPPLAMYREFAGMSGENGWQVITSPAGDDPPRTEFRKTVQAADQQAWHDLSGDLAIRAGPAGTSHADVRMINEIEVVDGRESGEPTLWYRETLHWIGFRETIIAFQADRYREAMAVGYPFLGECELAELRGLMTGALSHGWLDWLWEDDAEIQNRHLVAILADNAQRIVEPVLPDNRFVDRDGVMEIARDVVQDRDELAWQFVERVMPGLGLIALTDMQVSIRMPGRILETNAHRVEGETAYGEFELTEVLSGAVELSVRSIRQ